MKLHELGYETRCSRHRTVCVRRVQAMLSTPLKLHTKQAVDSGLRGLYLLNRRGFAPFVICGECSAVLRGAVSASITTTTGACSATTAGTSAVSRTCPSCGAGNSRRWGPTRVEEIIADTFHEPHFQAGPGQFA